MKPTFYFVTWRAGTDDQCRRFYRIDKLFEWLQEFRNTTGNYPPGLVIYSGECLFDGS